MFDSLHAVKLTLLQPICVMTQTRYNNNTTYIVQYQNMVIALYKKIQNIYKEQEHTNKNKLATLAHVGSKTMLTCANG